MWLQTADKETDILAEVGDGGFAAQEFELLEQIGQLSWVCMSAIWRLAALLSAKTHVCQLFEEAH